MKIARQWNQMVNRLLIHKNKMPLLLFMNDWKTSFKGVSIYAKILEGLYNLIYSNLIYRPVIAQNGGN